MNQTLEKKLLELLEFARENGLYELAWEEGDMKIVFKRAPTALKKSVAAPASVDEPVKEPLEYVRSPIVGTFRQSTAKNRPPLVMKGNRIKPGDRLAVVECMKIPTDVVSFCTGEIKELLVQEGQPVEYGQPIFSVLLEDPAAESKKN